MTRHDTASAGSPVEHGAGAGTADWSPPRPAGISHARGAGSAGWSHIPPSAPTKTS